MKKIISLVVTISMLLCTTSAVFADSGQLSDEKLIELAQGGHFVKNDTIEVKELENAVTNVQGIDANDVEVYVIIEKMGSAAATRSLSNEQVPVERYEARAIAIAATGGENEEYGSDGGGRVVATSIIGYESYLYNTYKHAKGTYYGGYVNSVESGVTITNVKGQYNDFGDWRNPDGTNGFAIDYNTSKTFTLSNCFSRQTQSVSRTHYYAVESQGVVRSKFIVTATRGTASFSFEVIADV